MSHRARQTFYKLVFSSFASTPRAQLRIFYKGIPLHVPAKFETDRYVFPLPLNLAEKLMAGDLIADFGYSEISDVFGMNEKSSESPTFIILSERYS